MHKSVFALASLLTAASLAACGTVRERDCRVLLPRLEEADESTALAGLVAHEARAPGGRAGNARGGDATRIFAVQAARSTAAARWLENAAVASEDLKHGVGPLVKALGAHGDAAKRADAALRALGFHATDGGSGPGPAFSRLFAPESRAQSPYLADAMTLNDRCGFFLAEPGAAHPECGALTAVLAHFLEPAPDAMASAHVADCLAALGAVHSPDSRVEKALRSAETIIREIGSALVAATRDGPASEIVAELRVLAKAAIEEQAAARDVLHSSAELRGICRTL